MSYIDQLESADGSTVYDIRDTDAYADAGTAKAQQILDLQVLDNGYEGRDITQIAELASEISSAGNVYKFLHNRATAQNYANLRVRDYITVPVTGYGNIRFDIGGFNTMRQVGDTALANHILFVAHAPVTMPNSSSYTVNNSYIMWNTTADNNGTAEESNPYLASNLHAWEIGEFLPALPATLQGYLIERRDYVEVRYSASEKLTDSTGGKWASLGKVWSPSEVEVYGFPVRATVPWSCMCAQQFPIFRELRDRIRGGRVSWWLRVVMGSSSSHVCNVGYNGISNGLSAAYTSYRGLPCFLLG